MDNQWFLQLISNFISYSLFWKNLNFSVIDYYIQCMRSDFLTVFNKYICKIHNTFEYNLCRFNTYMVLKIGDFFEGHPWKRVILATDAPSSSMSVICDTHFLMLPRICRCGKYRRNLSTTKMQAKHQPNHIIVTLNQWMLSVWILKHVMFY